MLSQILMESAKVKSAIWAIAIGVPLAYIFLRRSSQSVGLQPETSFIHSFYRYAFACVMVGFSIGTRLLLDREFPAMPIFTTIYPGVILAGLIGGTGPGIVATMLSALLVAYLFMKPVGSLSINASSNILALVIFTTMNLFLSVVLGAVQKAQRLTL